MAAVNLNENGPMDHVDIKEVIVCIWCKDQMSCHLVELECFHLSCEDCAKKHMKVAAQGSKLCCPKCHTVSTVPSSDVEELEDELIQYKIKEIAETFSDNIPSCNACMAVDEDTPSSHFCLTCKNYLCPFDAKRHKIQPDHKMVSNEELKSEQYLTQLITSKVPLCKIHSTSASSKQLDYYCKECQEPVCQDCVKLKHSNHEKQALNQTSHEFEQEIKEKISETIDFKTVCQDIVDKLQRISKDIEKNCAHCVSEIRKWGEGIKEIVDRIMDESIQNVEYGAKVQLDEIKSIEEVQNSKVMRIESAENYMQVFFKFGSEFDVIQKYQTYIKYLASCMKKNGNINVNATTYQVHNSGVKQVDKYLRGIIQCEENTTEIPIMVEGQKLSGCVLETKWTTSGWLGVAVDEEDVLVVVGGKIESYGPRGERKEDILCQDLKDSWDLDVYNHELYVSDYNQRVVLVVDRDGCVQKKVTLPSREEGLAGRALGLAVDQKNGELFICSRVTNTVYKYTGEKEHAVPWIFEDLHGPYYLCVTANHEIVVSNADSHTVCQFSSDRELMWTYGHQGSRDQELSGPQGVCVDPRGKIYIADTDNNRIHQLSAEGEFLRYIEIGETIENPQAITMENQRLIVTTGFPCKVFVVKLCKYE